MKRWERYSFNAAAALVAITGFVYLWMEYGMKTDDPFAVVNHPWQPHVLGLHVLAAPVLLVVFGIVFNSHIGRKLRSYGANRRTGMTALITFALMTVSGYLLQVVTTPVLRNVCLVAHIASGTIFAVSYTIHLVIGLRMDSRARGLKPAPPVHAKERLTA